MTGPVLGLKGARVSIGWETAAACGVCGATGWAFEREICGRRYGRCRSCGLVRLVDRVAEDQLSVIYAHYYAPTARTEAPLEEQLGNPTFAFRRRRLEAALDGRPRRFFEIGCGDGNFLAVLRGAGWAVSGSEYGATAEATARRHQLDVRPLDVAAVDAPADPFPAVGAYHVLEHMYDPAAWLRGVGRMLAPSGILHLQVPNYAALTRSLTGEAWASWRFPEHVYFYTPRTLRAALDRAGFDVQDETTWDPWHGPGTATASLVNVALTRLTGRSPWTADIEHAWSGTAQPGPEPAAPAIRRLGRSAITGAARILAGVESVTGRGAVVDVVARRR